MLGGTPIHDPSTRQTDGENRRRLNRQHREALFKDFARREALFREFAAYQKALVGIRRTSEHRESKPEKALHAYQICAIPGGG